MPETYAHFSFGEQVLKTLDDDIKNIVRTNLSLYEIGLHGPDILFYNEPFKSNHVSFLGNEMHKVGGDSFFERAKAIINKCEKPEAAFSYTAGFICHYMLDSELHPYIREKEKSGLEHSDIETEFERILMINNDIEPLSYRPTRHLVCSKQDAECIARFFKGIRPNEIEESIKSMKFYLDILVSLRHVKWIINNKQVKKNSGLAYKIGLIMSRKPIPECVDINIALIDLYTKAIGITSQMINEYYKNLKSNEPINNRFSRNFG